MTCVCCARDWLASRVRSRAYVRARWALVVLVLVLVLVS